ncbi:MAG TPA: hypothetical protein VN709_04030 [Terriglobales bacterium]|nr:hypothetical protein [Terriglobales bacterium]
MDELATMDSGSLNQIGDGAAEATVSVAESAPVTAPASAALAADAAVGTADEAASAAAVAPEEIEIQYPDEDPELDAEAEPAAAASAPGDEAPTAAKLGTAALSKLLKDNPALQQAADASPRVKAQLYQMARRSQELNQYQELLPSVTRAREAVQAATQLQNLDKAYFGDSPQQFWNSLFQAQTQPDPVTGQARSSGAYERNVQYLQRSFLDHMEQQAQRDKNNDLTGAVRSLRDALGWSPAQSSPALEGHGPVEAAPGAAHNNQLPAHIRQKLEQADTNARELEQLRLRRSEDEQRQANHFMGETAAEVAGELRGFVNGLLGTAKLSDYDKQNIARDFLEAVSGLAAQDKVHNAAIEEILRAGGHTAATRAKVVARSKAWARQNGRDILEPILARAGAGLKQRQAQREAAQTRGRSEPAAAGAPASPRAPSARDLVRSAETRLGRRLTDREILELA